MCSGTHKLFDVFFLTELCRPLHPLYPVVSMVFGLAQCKVRKYRNKEATSNEIINLLPTTNIKKSSDPVVRPDEGDNIKYKGDI